MKTRLFNYLRFNRAERNGTLALFVLATLFFAIPEIARHLRPARSTNFAPFQQETEAFRSALKTANNSTGEASAVLFKFDPNTASFDDFVRLGLDEKVSNIICNYREKGGTFHAATDFQKIWSLKKEDFTRLLPFIQIGSTGKTKYEKGAEKPVAEPFAFDPNTATEEDLLRLGLPDRTVKSMLNYRSKGGQFRKKEDLEKIYTLDDDDYMRIAPFATFSTPIASAATQPSIVYAGGFAASSKKLLVKGPVDINHANVEAWMSLPGIGEMRARQLVSFRDKLGGFFSVDQLGEMHGLPDSVFQGIKPYLLINTADIRKLDLNTVSVTDLDAHPYISKRQAELIIAYREQHGAFASPEDLGKMRAFSDRAWLTKVGPYLGVE